MGDIKNRKIRVVWEMEYTPDASEYPEIVGSLEQAAKVDLECGVIHEMIDQGKGNFQISVN